MPDGTELRTVGHKFFIRLLNEEDPLHENALGYFRYFLEHDFVIKISTIAIAEYCVRGEVSELPLKICSLFLSISIMLNEQER